MAENKPGIGMKLLTNPALNPIGAGINKLGLSMEKDKPQGGGQGATNLFSDEQLKYDQMTADGLDDTMSRKLITNNRKKLLSNISGQEKTTLLQMMEDGLDSQTAVKTIKEIRNRNLPLWKKALKVPFDASVGATSLTTEQVGNVLDFATGGQVPYFKEQVEGVKDVTERSFKGQPGFQSGRNIFGTGEMLATGPTKIANTMKGRALQGGAVGATIGGADPILSKGADVTGKEIVKGAAIGGATGLLATPFIEKVAAPLAVGAVTKVAKPLIQKGAKYGTATVKGGAEGLKKSVIRDVKRPFTEIKTKGVAPEKAAALSTKANRFNAKDIEDFQRITGETPGEFAVKRGMTKTGDQAVDEAAGLFKKSMDEADDAMNLIDGTFKVKKGPDYVKGQIEGLQNKLTEFSPEWKKVNLLSKKYDAKGLTMSEVNDLKRLYSRKHKYSWEQAMGKEANTSKDLQDGLRKWQFQTAKEQGFKNLSEINKTTQGWKTFADSLAKKLKRSSGNNNISLTDWVALSGGEPTNVALFLGKKIGEMPGVKSSLIKGLGKQTKPSIIKAKHGEIIKSNVKKHDINSDILNNRNRSRVDSLINKPKPLALPAGRGEGVKTQIGPRKGSIKLREKVEISRPKTMKTSTIKDTIDKKSIIKKVDTKRISKEIPEEAKMKLEDTIKAYNKKSDKLKKISYEFVENMTTDNNIDKIVREEFLRVVKRPKGLEKKAIKQKDIQIEDLPF